MIDLETLGRRLAADRPDDGVSQARALVAEEVAAYLAARRAQAVAPTVVALRAHARGVVDGELARLRARVGDLDPRVASELEQCVHRVVEKLLHTPTVRVKELAETPGGSVYADALGELFGLGPNVSGIPSVSTVSAASAWPATVPTAGGGAA